MELQNRLHTELERFVNGEAQTRVRRTLSIGAPGIALASDAMALAARIRYWQRAIPDYVQTPATLRVEPYEGCNAKVRSMIDALEPLRPALAGAFVHGSLATGDEIAYSDFDGLVILRDTTAGSPERLLGAALELSRLRRVMAEFDPLQHHGWFVLTETDLRAHCDAYFPLVLFEHSRSLLGCSAATVLAARRDSTAEFSDAFLGLAKGLKRRISTPSRARNVYQLKSVLSQAMLLPALYLQARYRTSVYKKDSFNIARQDFPSTTWAIMDRISAMRERWHYPKTGLLRAVSRHPRLGPRLAARFAPAVPPDLATELDDAFWGEMLRLIEALEAGLGDNDAL